MADKKKTRKAAPDDESKGTKFSRLASARVGNAVKQIELVGNLAGPGYEYTPSQVKKVMDLLTDATAKCAEMFKTGGAKSAKQGITI